MSFSGIKDFNLKLVSETDPALSTPAEAWDFATDGDPTELVSEMSKIMAANRGIGLAAPQIGVSKRLFVMGNALKLVACINPMIVSLGTEFEQDMEGCLSFPELYLRVRRATTCTVQYQTVTGESVERELSGIEARVFLHEMDHLLGITFDERVAKLSVKLAKERRSKEKKKSMKGA